MNGHNDTLTEASNLMNHIYRKDETQNQQNYREAYQFLQGVQSRFIIYGDLKHQDYRFGYSFASFRWKNVTSR